MYLYMPNQKLSSYLNLFLRYSRLGVLNMLQLGHALTHPLETIEQICNFYGCLTTGS